MTKGAKKALESPYRYYTKMSCTTTVTSVTGRPFFCSVSEPAGVYNIVFLLQVTPAAAAAKAATEVACLLLLLDSFGRCCNFGKVPTKY